MGRCVCSGAINNKRYGIQVVGKITDRNLSAQVLLENEKLRRAKQKRVSRLTIRQSIIGDAPPSARSSWFGNRLLNDSVGHGEFTRH